MKSSIPLFFSALTMGGCAASTPSPSTASNEAAPVTVVDLEASKPAKPVAKADPKEARKEALKEAAMNAGILGVLKSGDEGALSDVLTAKGNMWGGEIGEAFGAGGLGSSGTGVGGLGLSGAGVGGGGGVGQGIGLGSIGTLGHGGGGGTGQGYGSGVGRLGGSRSAPPRVRVGDTNVKGKLPREVIQRIVRQNFGRFRFCYENGLKSDPKLAGKVIVRFEIKADGAVSSVSDAGSTMPNATVKTCVLRAFERLSFPQPEGGGKVVVVYPLTFSPGDDPPAPPKAPPAPPAPPPPSPAKAP